MGLLFRMLAPKPLKKARRLAHPVSAVTPRSVRNVKRMGAKAVNPVGAVGDALETEVVRAARGSGARRRPRQQAADTFNVPAADANDVPADFLPGDILSEWMPSVRPASQVPILNSDTAFPVLEEYRLTASSELAVAVTDVARLEALLLINALYDGQVSMITALAESGRLDPPIDPDAARCWSWTKAWKDAAEQEWQQRINEQNALVASMDRATVEAVADNTATPRLQRIIARADEAGS